MQRIGADNTAFIHHRDTTDFVFGQAEIRDLRLTILVDQGRAVENVQITDQMSASWLKFVAPLFAEATRIDGRFSLDLNHARVPIADTAARLLPRVRQSMNRKSPFFTLVAAASTRRRGSATAANTGSSRPTTPISAAPTRSAWAS